VLRYGHFETSAFYKESVSITVTFWNGYSSHSLLRVTVAQFEFDVSQVSNEV